MNVSIAMMPEAAAPSGHHAAEAPDGASAGLAAMLFADVLAEFVSGGPHDEPIGEEDPADGESADEASLDQAGTMYGLTVQAPAVLPVIAQLAPELTGGAPLQVTVDRIGTSAPLDPAGAEAAPAAPAQERPAGTDFQALPGIEPDAPAATETQAPSPAPASDAPARLSPAARALAKLVQDVTRDDAAAAPAAGNTTPVPAATPAAERASAEASSRPGMTPMPMTYKAETAVPAASRNAAEQPVVPAAAAAAVTPASPAGEGRFDGAGHDDGHRPAEMWKGPSRVSAAADPVAHAVAAPQEQAQGPGPVHRSEPTAGADPDAAHPAEQIVKAMQVQIRDGIGQARVHLRPEHLGDVTIDVKVTGERVSAVLHVERTEVRAQVEASGAVLKAALAAQGLHLDELVVREDGRREESRQQEQQPQERRRRRPAGGQAFNLDDE